MSESQAPSEPAPASSRVPVQLMNDVSNALEHAGEVLQRLAEEAARNPNAEIRNNWTFDNAERTQAGTGQIPSREARIAWYRLNNPRSRLNEVELGKNNADLKRP